LLNRPKRPSSRGFGPTGYPAKPLVSYQTYRAGSNIIAITIPRSSRSAFQHDGDQRSTMMAISLIG